jgi:hypothetical protein
MAQTGAVVGIDVSKGKVDVAIRSAAAAATFADSAEGRRELLKWLTQHSVSKAVMEATGGYEQRWARLLAKAGLEVVIVDPKRVRHFAKSAGRLAKNDPIDAQMIAWFGEVFDDLTGKRRTTSATSSSSWSPHASPAAPALADRAGEHEQPKLVQRPIRRRSRRWPLSSTCWMPSLTPRSRTARSSRSVPRSSRACQALATSACRQ